MSHPAPIARVLRAELEVFLAQHGDAWQADGDRSFMESVPHLPLGTDEFVTSLATYRPDIDYVYVLSPETGLDDAMSGLDWSGIPLIDRDGLANYIVRQGRGDDFLWLFPSDEDLSNGTYVTLLPSRDEIEEDVQEQASVRRSGLTAISIENFKGIEGVQRIEFKPLTLLFGANSAGKSTLFHALHYAREVFERHNLDADETIAGGPFVDLGGFDNFVHDHDSSKTVLLRLEMDLADIDLPSYVVTSRNAPSIDPDSPLLTGSIRSGAVEIHISSSEARRAIFVSRYSVDINDEHFATIECHFGRRTVELTKLNIRHRLFTPDHAEEATDSQMESVLEYFWRTVTGEEFDPAKAIPLLPTQEDALPQWGTLLPLAIPQTTKPHRQGTLFRGLEERQQELRFEEGEFEHSMLYALLTQAIAGPGQVVRDLLRQFRYLGPLRETPPRDHSPPRFADPGRWAGGLGAWDLLHTGTHDFVDEVSKWLGDPERLNTGYEIIRKTVREIDVMAPAFWKPLEEVTFEEFEDLRVQKNGRAPQQRVVISPIGAKIELRPHDIGVGISQVVPVVVTALDGDNRLIAIEQPELHLHPRIQAELGDLFIESALGSRGHTVLLELHSEHLILRLLRRIRETSVSTPHRAIPINERDVAIYYARRKDGCTGFLKIDVDKRGDFIQPWPDDFFEIDFYERFGDAR